MNVIILNEKDKKYYIKNKQEYLYSTWKSINLNNITNVARCNFNNAISDIFVKTEPDFKINIFDIINKNTNFIIDYKINDIYNYYNILLDIFKKNINNKYTNIQQIINNLKNFNDLKILYFNVNYNNNITFFNKL